MKIIKIYVAILMTVLTTAVFAQSRMMSGHVVDGETNLALSGATVHSRELKIALGSTDNNGRFSIPVNDKTKTLIVKLMGYKDYTLAIDSKTNQVNIVMETAKNAMDEVVVVGYAQRSRETLTGSNVIISGKDIQDLPVGNVMELLQGRVPGLNIQNNNGAPGMRGAVTIRGVSTLNVTGGGNDAFLSPTSPLYIVDGVPIDDNSGYSYGFEEASPGISPISLIPTEDIQQIEVLKDASATSLYGSRGAYGVIIITTKRGQSKVPIVQYTSNFFMNTPPRLRNIIGGKGERRMRINQLIDYDLSLDGSMAYETIDETAFLSDSLNPYYNNSTNWQSVFYRTTYNQSHNVNISGGDINFNYKMNAGLYNEKGIVRNTGFTRYSLQMNGQYMPSNKFKMVSAISTNVGENSEGSGNSLRQSGVADGANTSSLLPSPSLYTASNDVLSAFNVASTNKSTNIKANLELQYEPLEGLRMISTGSYDYMVSTKDKFTPSSLNDNSNLYDAYNDNRRTLYNRNMISYVKQVATVHNFSANIFNELNMTAFAADQIRNIGTANDQILGPIGLNYASSRGGTLDNLSEVRSVAFAGSASYNYDTRYVFDFNYRVDGTSSNGPLNPYKINPSAGARWNFGKERFMEDVSWLDYASFRVSWGRNINPNGNIFDIYGRYISLRGLYNHQLATALNRSTAPNLHLEPTSNTQWNFALEGGFMDGRFSFTYEAYYKESMGIMDKKDISDIAAFDKVTTNEKALVNYGHELSLMVRPLSSESQFKWTLSGNMAYNKDVTTHLPDNMRQWVIDGGDTKQAILNRLGRNAFSNLLLHYRGVYATDDDVPVNPMTGLRLRTSSGLFFGAGDPIWTDLNGDYIIDENDYVVIGNSQPLLTGGISSHLQYKSWTLNVNTSFTLIRDVLNNANADLLRAYSNPANTSNGGLDYDNNQGNIKALVPITAFDFWKQYGDTGAAYPNPFDYMRYGSIQPFRYDQTLWMEDGSYVKINQITLSYNINRDFSQRYGISSLRVYGTMGNVYNFNRYSGPDPEIVSSAGRDSSGGYPNKRNFTFGLNVQF
ncbi:SusC/RagA family TonB-linked outer membrane protein [Sphingobacterium sp. SGG-5]|uniref:SusC/RagA family TonB-linked outer membrane protein n=1 Tax=Sphingobacterium sp. SGG-5 TaxID=2710881 RepID=UPI0013E9DD5C|nr:SusC/RagA family TonB-linked outer membrane protein [Sphingobacterium sp. SGG-5]NGM62510.1 SusC/RagA family TonB-linked outer membrane protein [Sphingobacterium sp. SGG-5]